MFGVRINFYGRKSVYIYIILKLINVLRITSVLDSFFFFDKSVLDS